MQSIPLLFSQPLSNAHVLTFSQLSYINSFLLFIHDAVSGQENVRICYKKRKLMTHKKTPARTK